MTIDFIYPVVFHLESAKTVKELISVMLSDSPIVDELLLKDAFVFRLSMFFSIHYVSVVA